MKKCSLVEDKLQNLSPACGKNGKTRMNSECPQLGEPYLSKLEAEKMDFSGLHKYFGKKKKVRICIECSLHSDLSVILSDKADALDLTCFLMKFSSIV